PRARNRHRAGPAAPGRSPRSARRKWWFWSRNTPPIAAYRRQSGREWAPAAQSAVIRSAHQARQMETAYVRFRREPPARPLKARQPQAGPALPAQAVRRHGLLKLRFAYRTRRVTPGEFQPLRFTIFESKGGSRPRRGFLTSPRPVSAWAIWRKISAVL